MQNSKKIENCIILWSSPLSNVMAANANRYTLRAQHISEFLERLIFANPKMKMNEFVAVFVWFFRNLIVSSECCCCDERFNAISLHRNLFYWRLALANTAESLKIVRLICMNDSIRAFNFHLRLLRYGCWHPNQTSSSEILLIYCKINDDKNDWVSARYIYVFISSEYVLCLMQAASCTIVNRLFLFGHSIQFS